MTISATNELGNHPCKEGLNGVVGKSTMKNKSLSYGNIARLEVKFCH